MRILHVFRSPVGGLFRHVRDLARGQASLGHDVAIFCDSSTGGQNAIDLLDETKRYCSLGIVRQAMSKMPGFGDISCAMQTSKLAEHLNIDVIHGHGAKGGLYARLAGKRSGKTAVYTPHGGSLHYDWNRFPGPVFLGTEKMLRKTNAGIVFVCEFEKQLFQAKIGLGNCKSVVVHNGLWPEEFSNLPVKPSAADLLFVGEMRNLKGVDVLLNAIALLKPQKTVTACLIGDGPDLDRFKALAVALGLTEQVQFAGRKSMHDAIGLGRIFVLPSRNESFPYVMLEAIAAHKPIIACDVGGISEVVPKSQLCASDRPDLLAELISNTLNCNDISEQNAGALASQIQSNFGAQLMAEKVTAFYDTCR
jgi:glycosyltransferase involved in cell wall biosynthesis